MVGAHVCYCVCCLPCAQLFSWQDNPWDQEAAWAESELKKQLDYAGGPISYAKTKKPAHDEHH